MPSLPEYLLIRTNRRRTVALMLRPDGTLEVRAPKHVNKSFIEAFIQERLQWIERKTAEQENRPRLQERTWRSGDTFYHMGTPHTLEVRTGNQILVEHTQNTLILYQKDPENRDRARHNLLQWYKNEAEKAFKPRLARLASGMEESIPQLFISNTKGRWGSCQGQKRVVRLSLRLLMAPKDVQDYVMVHELAHLKHMDHSEKFWRHVANFCPEWQRIEEKMAYHAGLWRFD